MKSFGLFVACAAALVQPFYGQDITPPMASQNPSANPGTPAVQPSERPTSRWLSLNTLSFSYRWRDMADSDGFHLFDTGQERSLIDGRLKLDAEGKYSVNFHISSGRYFNWAYADSIGAGFGDLATASVGAFSPTESQRFYTAIAADPAGLASISGKLASRGWEMYVRQLYFSATPIKQLSFEYGSLGLERGVNTEITSYDEDGYVAGERLRIHDPQHLYFDQVAVTFGYVGDYFTPNFFDRGDRLAHSNYHQFLVEKKFTKRLKASVDYTFQNSVDTMREAVLVQMPETRVLDSVRAELYQRTNDVTLQGATFGTGAGYAFTGSKIFSKKFQLEGGYASIDEHYTVLANSRFLDSVAYSLNGDSWGIGPRFFTRANYKFSPYASVFGFYTHALSTDYYMLTKQGMNFGMTVDFKSLLSEKLHLL